MFKHAFLTAAMALSAAAAYAGTPDWVSGESGKYPREQYITGVGTADDRQTAEDRARGEIAKVFSSNITVNTAVSSSETTLQAGKTQNTTFQQSVSQDVKTVSTKILEGVELVANWKDEKSRQVYALAILDRAKAASAITAKIHSLDTDMASYELDFEAADKNAEKFQKVKAAAKMMTMLKAREGLNADLKVISGNAIPAGAVDTSRLSRAFSDLDITVSVTGDAKDDVATGIINGLNSLKFGARAVGQDGGKPGDITVTAKSEVFPLKTPDNLNWVRIHAVISLQDVRNGKVFLQLDLSDKDASVISYDEATRRVLKSLGKQITDRINAGLSDYFQNL